MSAIVMKIMISFFAIGKQSHCVSPLLLLPLRSANDIWKNYNIAPKKARGVMRSNRLNSESRVPGTIATRTMQGKAGGAVGWKWDEDDVVTTMGGTGLTTSTRIRELERRYDLLFINTRSYSAHFNPLAHFRCCCSSSHPSIVLMSFITWWRSWKGVMIDTASRPLCPNETCHSRPHRRRHRAREERCKCDKQDAHKSHFFFTILDTDIWSGQIELIQPLMSLVWYVVGDFPFGTIGWFDRHPHTRHSSSPN